MPPPTAHEPAASAERLPEATWDWDLATGERVWSERCKALFGIGPSEEMSPERLLAAIDARDRGRVEDAVRRAVAGRTRLEVEVRVPQPEGGVRWVAATGMASYGADGRPLRISGRAHDVTEQRRIADALAASEERLRLALAAGRVGIWEWDIATDGVFWSPEAYAILGLAETATRTGKAFFSLVHPDDLPMVHARVAEALHGDRDVEIAFRVRRPDGTTRHVENRAALVRDPSGAPLRFVGTVRDLTDERAASEVLRAREEALREEQERLEAALCASGTGTFRWDLRTNALHWDDNLDRLFGLKPGLRVRSLDEFVARVHPADREPVVAMCRRCAAEGTDFALEFRVVWPDGAVRWIEDRGRTYRDADGRPSYMTGACVDVTARRTRDAELAASEARFRQLADAMPQIVWTAAADGRVDYFNRRWYELTGAPSSEADWSGYVHPEDRDRAASGWRASVAAGRSHEIELRLRFRDSDAFRWFLVRAVPVPDDAGQVVRWYGTSTDIHDRRLAEEALQRANDRLRGADRRKDEFLAMLSHELRNPLAPIRNAAHVLERAAPDGEPAARARAVLRRQSDHLTRLVDDLLDVTRITQGKISLRTQSVDLRETVVRAAEDFRLALVDRGIRLRMELPDVGVWALADETRLNQVVTNLLHNAAKFTPRGGEVVVALRDEAGWAELHVRDTGVGIDPALLPHVFDPFVQGERTLARSEGGLGLGLALVRGIVELHGGEIRAESGGVGRGAQFVIRVPALVREARVGVVGTGEGAATCARRVLVVDDNVDAAESLADLLRLQGHRVETAFDGPSALAKLHALGPEVILCDIGLPGMSGYEVARAIRGLGRADVRLVALTGYAQADDVARALSAGFDAHVAKPPDPEKLAGALG